MKLHYIKILLFFLPLNILLTSSSNVNTQKKTSITARHTPIYISRVLSECDTQSLIHDKDADMKSVKQQFDDRTSQRFKEYEERMKDKRQKRKEQRDKNIQKIIEKDKMEKSLAEKVEKGCLMCGCALGGGVLPVWGLVSGLWYATWSQYLSAKALPAGISEGIKEGLAQIIKIFENVRRSGVFPGITVEQMLSTGKFTNSVTLFDMVQQISNSLYNELGDSCNYFWTFVDGMAKEISITDFNNMYAENSAAVAKAVEEGKALKFAEFAANTSLLSNTIIASVVAILVIVLVMIIIYLVLRYRRKKKMNKKAQYTKLLNQ
ncbi:rifin PIR protein,putative [Plasmodium sp. DRC-Itaito]|nr:rifin PIR protein,putative [Plasmodium sp. DRC-Itaito]